jgi:hypothetical protein
VAIFTSQLEAEQRHGAARFAASLDDDGDGVADAVLVTKYVDDADDFVRVFLQGKGFTKAQVELAPIKDNKTLRNAATDILIGMAGERKPEWRDEQGRGRHDVELKRGKEMLGMLAKGELRIPEAGTRTNLGGRITAPDPVFTIAPSSGNPKGPGGF